jgi:hypothetical protein
MEPSYQRRVEHYTQHNTAVNMELVWGVFNRVS